MDSNSWLIGDPLIMKCNRLITVHQQKQLLPVQGQVKSQGSRSDRIQAGLSKERP